MIQFKTISDLIVDAARRQIGTPFVHQGRVPGQALDCVGLLVVVGRECGLVVTDCPTYPAETDGEILRRCMEAACDRISPDQAQPGDILVFLRGRGIWHAGIVSKTDPLTIIHSWRRFTGGGVREEALTEEWIRRIETAWRYRD